MANPNIVNVATITGRTNCLAVTTATSNIVFNPSTSNSVYKINSLMVSNIDGANSADVTVDVFKNQTTSFKLASTISVPADSTLVVVSRETSIYLEENDSIRLSASANGDLEAVCSFEIIS